MCREMTSLSLLSKLQVKLKHHELTRRTRSLAFWFITLPLDLTWWEKDSCLLFVTFLLWQQILYKNPYKRCVQHLGNKQAVRLHLFHLAAQCSAVMKKSSGQKRFCFQNGQIQQIIITLSRVAVLIEGMISISTAS